MNTSKVIHILLKALFIGLVINAALIFLESVMEIFTGSSSTIELDRCCREECSETHKFSQLKRAINYKEISSKIPHIDPSYHNMLVRLGSDLNFDLNQCPSGSLMPTWKENFTPKHLDCPTLFLVGARKAGTSSLYHYIVKHPDFEGTKMDAGPKVGETFYFSHFYEIRKWEQYLSLFPSGGMMTGDASVGNLVHHLAPRRLYESCGKQAKVIILFRDPINRFESNFLMRSRLGGNRIGNTTAISTVVKLHLDLFFDQALSRTLNVKEMQQEWSKLVNLFLPSQNLVYEGLYYVHLLNWLCNFPAENILILNSEEFYRNPSSILDIVYQFLELKRLNLETYNWITSSTYNRGKYNVPYYQKLSLKDKTNLLGVYRPFNKVLLNLLQWQDLQWHH